MQGERASAGAFEEAFFDDPAELEGFLNFVGGIDTTIPNSAYHEQREAHRFRMETGQFEGRNNEGRAVRNVNLNAECTEHFGDMHPFMSHPGVLEVNGFGSGPLPQSSVRADGLVGGSRKRKALDMSIGQPSSSRGSREFHRGESSSRVAPAPSYFTPVDLNVPLDHGPRALASAVPNRSIPSVSRSFPVRANPTSQQVTANPAMFSAGSVIRRPAGPSSSSQAAQQPINLGYGNALNSFGAQNPNASPTSLPAVSRTMIPPFQWSGSSVVAGVSSSSAPSVDRIRRVETIPRINIVSASGLRAPPHLNVIPNPVGAGHVGLSSSRTAGLPAPANPYQNHPAHDQRRISEHLQRSLLSSLAQNQRAARSSVPPASTVERVVLQPGGGHTVQGQNRSFPRPGPRQGLNPNVTPQNWQGLPSASRARRSQMALEIRSALDQMHREGNLRVQDIMLLNQSMVLGRANIADQYRDMRVDVDNMSYEELLSLGERIGDVCTGMNEETISHRLKQHKFKSSTISPQEVEPCCVCQEEYKEGEDMGRLECGHDFHSQCIKEWLKLKNLCPICKTTGLNTTVGR